MNQTKKTIEKLEKSFESHEVWTRAEVKQVLNQTWLDSQTVKEYDDDNDSIKESLKSLVKEITEIPDGDVDRWLIIAEIEKIIKENKS